MISYIRGYYVITVEGVSVERFLNHLMRNGIKVYNVKKISSTKIEFNLDREDIKAFKNVYRGSNFQVKIKQSTGLPFILKRIYKNKGMWICGVISLFLLIMTSQFVTDIYIQVPEGIKKEDIRKELYQVGLKPGVYKKSIDRKEIRDHIMLKFNDVAYLSINVKGTNIFVTVTKKAETLKSVEQSNYCNIIAKKDGIIEKVIARSGNSVVQKGDIVRKGDVLINGSNNKSIPEVWATTFYEASKSASYEEVVKEKTGNKKNVYTLSFYDNKYTIRRNIKYNDYVIENEEYKLSLGNYTFPLKLKVSTFYETKDKKIEKDKEQVKKELKEKTLKELDYIIPASARIVDSKHDYKVNKNMLEYTITVQTSENIANVYSLSKAEAENMIREQNTHKEGEEVVPSNPEKRPINDIMFDIEEITNECIISEEGKILNDYFFNDEKFLEEFKHGIGGVSMHHNYIGGLAEHTLNVMYLTKVLCDRYNCKRREVTVLSAKLHDIGKLYELDYKGPFKYTLQGELEGHIVIGVQMIDKALNEIDYPFSEDFIRRIKGCITQHHGKLEYGSPRACNMEESFILNYADTVDATMNKIEQIKENTKEDTWSDYDRRIETKLYL